MHWNILFAVGVGGAFGAMARYVVVGQVARLFAPGFPYGTLAANIIGSFLMGVLVESAALRLNLTTQTQAFIAVGLLGGFTTFSSFSLELVLMIDRHELGPAFLYIALSVILSVGALFFGLALTRAIIT